MFTLQDLLKEINSKRNKNKILLNLKEIITKVNNQMIRNLLNNKKNYLKSQVLKD